MIQNAIDVIDDAVVRRGEVRTQQQVTVVKAFVGDPAEEYRRNLSELVDFDGQPLMASRVVDMADEDFLAIVARNLDMPEEALSGHDVVRPETGVIVLSAKPTLGLTI